MAKVNIHDTDRRSSYYCTYCPSMFKFRDHCQRSSPSQISHTLRAGFEPAQNLSSGLVE